MLAVRETGTSRGRQKDSVGRLFLESIFMEKISDEPQKKCVNDYLKDNHSSEASSHIHPQ